MDQFAEWDRFYEMWSRAKTANAGVAAYQRKRRAEKRAEFLKRMAEGRARKAKQG